MSQFPWQELQRSLIMTACLTPRAKPLPHCSRGEEQGEWPTYLQVIASIYKWCWAGQVALVSSAFLFQHQILTWWANWGKRGQGLSLLSWSQVEQFPPCVSGGWTEDENPLTLSYFYLKGSFSNTSRGWRRERKTSNLPFLLGRRHGPILGAGADRSRVLPAQAWRGASPHWAGEEGEREEAWLKCQTLAVLIKTKSSLNKHVFICYMPWGQFPATSNCCHRGEGPGNSSHHRSRSSFSILL